MSTVGQWTTTFKGELDSPEKRMRVEKALE